jgi:hypothetical protein
MAAPPILTTVLLAALGAAGAHAAPVMLTGGGTKRTDCMGALSALGTSFPGGKPNTKALGVTCKDGDQCDGEAAAGACRVEVAVCLNAVDPGLPRCVPTEVRKVKLKQLGKKKKRIDIAALQAAIGALPLPTRGTVCTDPVRLAIPLPGPDRNGVEQKREVKLELRTVGRGGRKETDQFELVCTPGGASVGGGGGGGGGSGGGGGVIVLVRSPGAGLAASIVES